MSKTQPSLRDELRAATVGTLLFKLQPGLDAGLTAAIIHELGRRRAVEAAEALVAFLGHPEPAVRIAAADALGDMQATATAGPALLSLLQDASQPPEVRDTIAYAFSRAPYPEAVPALVEALRGPTPSLRICAAAALAATRDPTVCLQLALAARTETDERVIRALRKAIQYIQSQNDNPRATSTCRQSPRVVIQRFHVVRMLVESMKVAVSEPSWAVYHHAHSPLSPFPQHPRTMNDAQALLTDYSLFKQFESANPSVSISKFQRMTTYD